ncbi:Thioredoxin domain-containing protein 3, partial [Coemansia sp. RSA 1285]
FSLLFEDIRTRDCGLAAPGQASPANKSTATSRRQPTNRSSSNKMDVDPNANRTFAIVKPDALTPFKYQQIDALIKLNEFSIARQKLVWLTEELADALFPDKASDADRQEWLDYITSAPSLALELEKVDAPLFWQLTMGAEDPSETAGSDTDSIRGILAVDRIRNAVDG